MREDCRERLESVRKRIDDAMTGMEAGDHLRALGALEGIDEQVQHLRTMFKVIEDFSHRKE